MIEIKDLKKRYGERTVLDIPKLKIARGEAVAFAGPNGSGKTTLLRILAGLLKMSEGEIAAPEKTVYMPQQTYAFKGDLIRNITLTGADKESALRLLDKLGLSELAKKKASSLSGGESQRLSLCRVLALPCDLLLLDEPTSACDAEGAALVMDAVKEHQKEFGCTVLMSTHSPVLAAKVADRLILLNGGRIEADGEPKDVLGDPSSEWTANFTAGWKI